MFSVCIDEKLLDVFGSTRTISVTSPQDPTGKIQGIIHEQPWTSPKKGKKVKLDITIVGTDEAELTDIELDIEGGHEIKFIFESSYNIPPVNTPFTS